MMTSLDHVVEVQGPSGFERALIRAKQLFEGAPDWHSVAAASASFEVRLAGGAIEVIGLAGEPSAPARGLKSLVLASDDLDADRDRLASAGLQPSQITAAESVDRASGASRSWRRFRCADAVLGGLKLFVLERFEPPATRSSQRLADVTIECSQDVDHARWLFGDALSLTGVGDVFALGDTSIVLARGDGAQHRIASLNVTQNEHPEQLRFTGLGAHS